MRQLIIFITLAIIAIPQISYAEDEVIWETEQITYLHDIKVAPQGDIFYNIKGKDIQIRRIDDGMLLDSIIMDDIPNYLYHMSISADGRYMALIGDNPYVIIYDLQEKREVKRITALVFEQEVFGENRKFYAKDWTSASISADGKRITGIAQTPENYTKTNFLVIDIETEEILLEERRITYDAVLSPERSYKWISAEYTPDGNYIVAQLDYGRAPDIAGPDTIYIYNAHTLELHDKVLAYYIESRERLEFSSYSPVFAFTSHDYKNKVSHKYIYDIQNKTTSVTNMNPNSFGLVFSRNSNQVIYGFGFENHIYDINTREVIYEYENPKVPRVLSLDNNILIASLYNNIYGMKTFFTTTSVEDNQNEIVISPNPTSSIANVSIDCNEPFINYQINDVNGLLISESSIENHGGNLQIDFMPYPAGVYFLTIQCNNPKTYKIVKEG